MADGSVIIEAILDTANVPKQLNNLKTAIKGVTWDDITKGTDSAKAVSAAFKSAGASCTAMFTAPIVAAGTSMTKMSWEFDDAMAKVSTIADTTEVPLDELREAILDLSDDTGIAASDIADNVYNAISAGQSTGEAVEFVRQATKLATAGFTDSASALDVLTTTLNAYNDETLDAAKVSDILLQTQNKGKTTVGELAASMGKAIPTAAAFNVNLEQLAAAYATTTANGIATAESTTYINSMIKELGDSGSEVGKIIQDELGMSFSDAMASGMSLGDVLNVLNKHGEETGQTMYDMFGSAEAAAAAATISADGAGKFTENLEAMGEAAGLTDESFEKMQTTTFDLNKAINQIKNVMIELGNTIGTALQPAIDGFVEGVHNFSEWFKSIGPQGQQFILVIAGIVAAIGPLLTVIGNVIAFIPQLKAGFTALSGAMSALTGGTGALGGALGALTGPVGIVIGIIAALVAAVVYLWNTDEGFRDSVMAAWEQIQAAISDAIEAAMPYIEQIVEFITGTVMPVVSQILQLVIEAMAQILSVVASVMPNILGIISGVLETIKGVFDTVIGFIVGLTTGDFTQMQQGIDSIMHGIQTIISNVWEAIKTLVGSALAAIGNAVQSAFNAVAGFVSGIWNNIQSTISGAINGAASVVSGVVNGISSTVSGVFNGVLSTVTGIWNGIQSAITSPIETAKGIVQGAINTISSIICGARLELPSIKLPHFNIDGGEVPWGIGGKGYPPSISIDWYAKGGIFNTAQIIGIGEAGREAALPLNSQTYDEIAQGINRQMGGIDYSALASAVVRELLRAGFGTTVITLDGRVIAKAVAGSLDTINGTRLNKAARGWAQ